MGSHEFTVSHCNVCCIKLSNLVKISCRLEVIVSSRMFMEKFKILVYKLKIIEVKCIHVWYKAKLASRHRVRVRRKGTFVYIFIGVTGCPPLN